MESEKRKELLGEAHYKVDALSFQKLRFIIKALEELCRVNLGFHLAKKTLTFPEINEIAQEKDVDKAVFSDYCEFLKGFDMWKTIVDRTPDLLSWTINHKGDFEFFDMDFEFSDNPGIFEFELHALVFLFACLITDGFISSPFGTAQEDLSLELPQKDDPRVDRALMKALFQAGKMIERSKHEGKQKSDIPTRGGSSPWKGYIDEQIYFNLFYSKSKGETRNAVCENIRKEAIRQEQKRAEAKDEKSKKVLSVKSIRERLKPDLDKLFA
ncbi:MAG: hypothetical protein H8D67_24805 [Deltaproteobacteria bacterium]|nr:hypothetical protein [Deltaproteobacteria bacterium]MBL7203687.1 hypothetical protein [Desulfobacteraceae bacterium]